MKKQILAIVLFSTLAICSSTVAMYNNSSIVSQIIRGFDRFFEAVNNHSSNQMILKRENEQILLCTQIQTIFTYLGNSNQPFEQKTCIGTIDNTIYDLSPTYQKLKKITAAKTFVIGSIDLFNLRKIIFKYREMGFNPKALEPVISKFSIPNDNMIIDLNR